MSLTLPPDEPTGPQITVTAAIASKSVTYVLSTNNASISMVACFCPAPVTGGQPVDGVPEGFQNVFFNNA